MVPILALTLTPLFVFTGFATLVAALGVGFWLYRKDDAIEQRRKKARELGDVLKANGLTLSADILDCYVIGDYDGGIDATMAALTLLTDPASRKAHLQELAMTLVKRQAEDDPVFAEKLLAQAEFYKVFRRNQQEAEAEIAELKREMEVKKAQGLVSSLSVPAKK